MFSDICETLFWPVQNDPEIGVGADSRILFLNAVSCPALYTMRASGAALTCVQPFRPLAAALEAEGFAVSPHLPEGHYTHVFIFAPKQMDEMRGLIADGLSCLAPDGKLLCAAANDAGGKRLPKLMEELGLEYQVDGRNRARVVWGGGAYHQALAEEWKALAAPRVLNGFKTQPGLFSWDRLDPGSTLLLEHIPPLKGKGADFGCGYGYLSQRLLARGDAITALHLLDADARALAHARENTHGAGTAALEFHWADLTKAPPLPANLDWVIMNPPFHIGAKTAPDVGAAFIENAARVLHRAGRLYMVANAHLAYEGALTKHFFRHEKLFEGHGFKIYVAEK